MAARVLPAAPVELSRRRYGGWKPNEPDGLKNRLELVPSVQGTPATMMLLQVNWLGSYREKGHTGHGPASTGGRCSVPWRK